MYSEQTPLDQAIASAYEKSGDRDAANHAWLTLLRTPLFLPVDPHPPEDPEEAFQPLYAVFGDHCFIVAFDTPERIETWSKEQAEKIHYVTLSGRDLIAGMGENVFLALNVGTPFYKEFSPDEVKHLKKIIARVDQLRLDPADKPRDLEGEIGRG